jgi:septal ring factor EnvC (AmiA/AmiB activator)
MREPELVPLGDLSSLPLVMHKGIVDDVTIYYPAQVFTAAMEAIRQDVEYYKVESVGWHDKYNDVTEQYARLEKRLRETESQVRTVQDDRDSLLRANGEYSNRIRREQEALVVQTARNAQLHKEIQELKLQLAAKPRRSIKRGVAKKS